MSLKASEFCDALFSALCARRLFLCFFLSEFAAYQTKPNQTFTLHYYLNIDQKKKEERTNKFRCCLKLVEIQQQHLLRLYYKGFLATFISCILLVKVQVFFFFFNNIYSFAFVIFQVYFSSLCEVWSLKSTCTEMSLFLVFIIKCENTDFKGDLKPLYHVKTHR